LFHERSEVASQGRCGHGRRVRADASGRAPTSVVLDELLHEAPPDISLGSVIDRLQERSFGLVALLLALIALVPGLSSVIGVLLTVPSVQMMLNRHGPVLPGFIASRRVQTSRLAALIGKLLPSLRFIETLIRPRWPTPFRATKRAVGGIILLLSLTLVAPIPLSHIIPSGAIMLVALAYLEEDGVLLSLAILISLVSLAITGATVWATIAGIESLE
jgi:hypothetical protein